MRKSIALLFLLSLSVVEVYTQTKVPSFFADNMVLQRKQKVKLWGFDNSGTEVQVITNWGVEVSTITNKKGKWIVEFETPDAGRSYTIKIHGTDEILLNNVAIGEVWICSGQSNMEMPVKGFPGEAVQGANEVILNSKNDNIRMISLSRNVSLTPLDDVELEHSWQVASPANVGNFSAVGYFFAKKLEALLDVPIGIIHTSWGGSRIEAWMDRETLAAFKTIPLENLDAAMKKRQRPFQIYNAMLHPMIGYGIKGAAWYQGESNLDNSDLYKDLFSELINSWRTKWNQGDFPFYFVQIAPFQYSHPDKIGSALLREAQLQTMQSVKNTGMVVTSDVGHCENIHPMEKKAVGDRLAYWALSKTYGLGGVTYSGPIYRKIDEIKDNKVTLSFEHGERGYSNFQGKGKDEQFFKGFEIAGENKVFHAAQARAKYQSVVVWSDKVKKPVAVRYNFRNCSDGDFFNVEGLPASPFRTDDWNEKTK